MTRREAGLEASRRITAGAPKRRKVYHSTEDRPHKDDLKNRTQRRTAQRDDAGEIALHDKLCSSASDTENETVNYSKLTGLEIVRDFEPPVGEEEYISKATQRRDRQCFWAPLLGGTTMAERAQILHEIEEESKTKPVASTYHPDNGKSLLGDPQNSNRLLVYEDQNPQQRLSIAGAPKNLLHLDPPGSKKPFDAAKPKYHDGLVGLLNRMDADTLAGWDTTSLKKVPVSVMERLTPEALNCMPEQVLSRLPSHIRDKLPAEADYLKDSKPKIHRDDLDGTFALLATQKMKQRMAQGQKVAVDVKNRPTASEVAYFACLECISIGIRCNLERPKCHACQHFGEKCSYRGRRATHDYDYSKTLFLAECRYLEFDLTSLATQRHLSKAATDHLTLNLAKTSIPATFQPKATYSTQPNVRKKPMRKGNPEQLTNSKAWNSAAEISRTLANNLANPLRSVQNPIAPSRGETPAYPFSSAQEETFHLRPSIRITIPDHLKNLLVDDWENVTKSLLLVPLPSKAPANFIIDTYFDEEKGSRRLGSAEADVLEEFCAGMKVYFEKSVGKILLYRFERGQLAEIRHLWESGKYPEWENKGPGDAYGAEHLCRMLVNLPELIAQTNMDSQSVNRLREEISKFCTWLARNSGRFFCAKYEKPTAEYIENAR